MCRFFKYGRGSFKILLEISCEQEDILMNYIAHTKAVIAELESHTKDPTKLPHVAAMRSEYDSDQSRCLTTVFFLPTEIRRKVKKLIIDPLQQLEPEHYFYPEEDLHLTLKNIRTNHFPPDFTEDDVKRVDDFLKKLVVSLPPLHFTIEGLIVFPTNIWLPAYANEDLQYFIQEMDRGLNALGLNDNRKRASDTYFWANISVCRFVHPPTNNLTQKAQELRHLKIGEISVHHIDLVTANTAFQKRSRSTLHSYAFNNK